MSLLHFKATYCHYNQLYLSFICKQQLLAAFPWDLVHSLWSYAPILWFPLVSFRPPLIKNPNINSQWDFNQGTANATPGCSKTSVGSLPLFILTCAWGCCPVEKSQLCQSFGFLGDCLTLSCKMPWYFYESIMPYMCWSFPVPEEAKHP